MLEGFHRSRVLCVGDVMLDRFSYGRVERVSDEAPIQILHVGSQRSMLGGAGNVVRNVVALGARAILIAVTGDDDSAREIDELAESEERLEQRLVVDPSRPTTVKTRFIAEGQQLLRADSESTDPVGEETTRRLIEAIAAELRHADVMVLSDYMKGVLTDELLSVAIAKAKVAGVPVIVDPKREDFSVYSGATVLKPNRAELEAGGRQACQTDAEIELAARGVARDCRIDAVLVTRSQQGMSLIRPDCEALHLRAKALEVSDVSGAGDTVVATTAVALASGAALHSAAELANIAGGIVVGKLGTAVVSREELGAALIAADASATEAKVKSAEAAYLDVQRWRKKGCRIGFTNGCFDLLHPGHISLLTEAKSHCDRLIVGLNSDESVKRLKGSDRPVQPEAARAIVLASMNVVDRVVIYSDDTPIPLLYLLEPDVLIKGGDYTIDEVIGGDVVQGYGGVVKIASLAPGHSSSEVIAKMSAKSRRSTSGLSGWNQT
ncbi:MAG: D-glycero-beta-D-manno-heptose-7-phosphate kinase [Deltaproteobacteria bacterium]|nr:D-glycero-beta-D-manno-heptose-7-phosphate kinase [Deltaproteobacteria bacterium]